MTPQTIDEVIVELDQIILRARNEHSRVGFFARRSCNDDHLG